MRASPRQRLKSNYPNVKKNQVADDRKGKKAAIIFLILSLPFVLFILFLGNLMVNIWEIDPLLFLVTIITILLLLLGLVLWLNRRLLGS